MYLSVYFCASYGSSNSFWLRSKQRGQPLVGMRARQGVSGDYSISCHLHTWPLYREPYLSCDVSFPLSALVCGHCTGVRRDREGGGVEREEEDRVGP